MTLPLTTSLSELSELLGPLPAGDTPAAWWYSTHPEVLAGYRAWEKDHTSWRYRMGKLYECSGFSRGTRMRKWKPESRMRVSGLGESYLVGLVPPPQMGEVPRFWRLNPQGLLVPRRYTLYEKNSQVNRLFNQCRHIPRAVDYLPGIQGALFIPDTPPAPTSAYPVHARKPGDAVLAFVGWPPQGASPPFEPDPEMWTSLKLSTWHLLRERQKAATTLDQDES